MWVLFFGDNRKGGKVLFSGCQPPG